MEERGLQQKGTLKNLVELGVQLPHSLCSYQGTDPLDMSPVLLNCLLKICCWLISISCSNWIVAYISCVVVDCKGCPSKFGLAEALMCLICLVHLLSKCFMCRLWKHAAWKTCHAYIFLQIACYGMFFARENYAMLIFSNNKIYLSMFSNLCQFAHKATCFSKLFSIFFYKWISQSTTSHTMPHPVVQLFLQVSACNVEVLLINQYLIILLYV